MTTLNMLTHKYTYAHTSTEVPGVVTTAPIGKPFAIPFAMVTGGNQHVNTKHYYIQKQQHCVPFNTHAPLTHRHTHTQTHAHTRKHMHIHANTCTHVHAQTNRHEYTASPISGMTSCVWNAQNASPTRPKPVCTWWEGRGRGREEWRPHLMKSIT